jgi:hypothetical protein
MLPKILIRKQLSAPRSVQRLDLQYCILIPLSCRNRGSEDLQNGSDAPSASHPEKMGTLKMETPTFSWASVSWFEYQDFKYPLWVSMPQTCGSLLFDST